ncbi:MAG: nickel pincer cofactor biosynthesis protein LarC, partial [bacterium]
MRFIRFDSVGGASGDMLLGALAAIGADLRGIERTVRKFLPDGVRFVSEAASDHGLNGVRATVRCADHHAHDHWPDAHAGQAGRHGRQAHAPHRTRKDIAALLKSPALDADSRDLALAVFDRLAVAEGKIHGKKPAEVHFHEIGATDSIADIVGCCLALRQLNVAGVSVGPLPCGTGIIQCAHGAMPNPAPATLELLAGMEVCQTDEPFELVTPTGAALLGTWIAKLQAPPASAQVVCAGFGFGKRELRSRPNVLRATLLEGAGASDTSDRSDASDILVLETNLDDCNPQWIGELITRLLAAGALDAWATPVTMKKGRPGIILSALAAAAQAAALREHIFRATTTFGIRSYAVTREMLDRRFETVKTPFGDVRVKIGSRNGEDLVRSPEFEDCARLARAHDIAPRQVYDAAV